MSTKLVFLLCLPYTLVRLAEGSGYAPAPNCCNIVCCCPSCGNDCHRNPPIEFGGCNCQGCSGRSWQQTIHGFPNNPSSGYRPSGPLWNPYGQFPPSFVSIPPVPYQPSAQPAPPPPASYPAPPPTAQPAPPPPAGYPAPSYPAPPPTVKPLPPSYQTAAPHYPTVAPPGYVSPKYPTAAPQSYASPPSPAPPSSRPPVYASPPPPPSYVSPPPAPTYVPRPPPIAPAPFYPVGPPAVVPCGGPCNCEPCPGFWQMLWDFFTHGWGLALLIASLILLFLLCFLIGVVAFRQMQKRHDYNRRSPHVSVHPIGNPNVHSRVVNQSPNQV